MAEQRASGYEKGGTKTAYRELCTRSDRTTCRRIEQTIIVRIDSATTLRGHARFNHTQQVLPVANDRVRVNHVPVYSVNHVSGSSGQLGGLSADATHKGTRNRNVSRQRSFVEYTVTAC